VSPFSNLTKKRKFFKEQRKKIFSYVNRKDRQMELFISLLIWLITVIVVFFIARRYQIRVWSALILAILIGSLILGLLAPITTIPTLFTNGTLATGIYALIMFLTPILLLIYIIGKAVSDREPISQHLFSSLSKDYPHTRIRLTEK
jgi:hypothetical protein